MVWNQKYDASSFILSQDCFGSLWSFMVVWILRFFFFFYFCEKCCWDFDRSCNESLHQTKKFLHKGSHQNYFWFCTQFSHVCVSAGEVDFPLPTSNSFDTSRLSQNSNQFWPLSTQGIRFQRLRALSHKNVLPPGTWVA